ncbi:MAG: hypothetical protein U0L49_11640 [Eubacterium sp.]|nr:hypothetical protein [Eubacterium sp.]
MDKAELEKFSAKIAEKAVKTRIPAVTAVLDGENEADDENVPEISITMSQGYYTSVPHGPNRLWDFMGHADRAVYDIKKKAKGGISILTYEDIKKSGQGS